MNLDAPRAAFRSELGLPKSGRLVMTGHQCSLWHAGIFAKYLACARMLPRDFDSSAWLWVDQDTDQTHSARVPVRNADRLAAAVWPLKPQPGADIPVAAMPPFTPAPFAGNPALPQVQAGIERATRALSRHSDKPNAARQLAAALTDLMSPIVPAAPQVFATDFMRTSLGAALLRRIADDPAGCTNAYNRAVAATPGPGIAPLRSDADETELPLWRIAAHQPRHRVHASTLASTDPASLAPRALLMTGMARLGACDLFVHGTGGGGPEGYDTITEAWFSDWLGATLAPTLVVTANLPLPLHAREVSARDAADARWRAHHARHDPAMLNDAPAARRKAALLDAIRHAKQTGADPAPHYAEMHRVISASRTEHKDSLARLQREAEHAQALLNESALATDRAWPFVFHEEQTLRDMNILRAPTPRT